MSKSYLSENSNEPLKSFNVILPYPKAFTMRCIDCSFGRSKTKEGGGGNNPMLTRKWEIASPDTINIEIDGEKKTVAIAGLTVMDWLTMVPKTASIVEADSKRLGVENPDDEMPNTQAYIGKTALAFLSTEVIAAKDKDTGDPILGSDGKAVINYRHSIVKWI